MSDKYKPIYDVNEIRKNGYDMEKVKAARNIMDPGLTHSLLTWTYYCNYGMHIKPYYPNGNMDPQQRSELSLCGKPLASNDKFSLRFYDLAWNSEYKGRFSRLLEYDAVCDKCMPLFLQLILEEVALSKEERAIDNFLRNSDPWDEEDEHDYCG
jgi:hypothetical protein